jgi:hypothetical protein
MNQREHEDLNFTGKIPLNPPFLEGDFPLNHFQSKVP